MNKDNVYYNLNTKFFDKNRVSGSKKSVEGYGKEDGKNQVLFEVDSYINAQDYDNSDGAVLITIDSDVGYISFSWKPDIHDLVKLSEMLVIRLQSAKNAIEGLNSV